jgi:hypothetical protein
VRQAQVADSVAGLSVGCWTPQQTISYSKSTPLVCDAEQDRNIRICIKRASTHDREKSEQTEPQLQYKMTHISIVGVA